MRSCLAIAVFALEYVFKSLPRYTNSCHSLTEPLQNGDLWIYPRRSALRIYGEKSLLGYEFLHKDSLHSFCETCGVSVLVSVTEPGKDFVPINVRTLNGIDLASLKLKKFDGRAQSPQYVIA